MLRAHLIGLSVIAAIAVLSVSAAWSQQASIPLGVEVALLRRAPALPSKSAVDTAPSYLLRYAARPGQAWSYRVTSRSSVRLLEPSEARPERNSETTLFLRHSVVASEMNSFTLSVTADRCRWIDAGATAKAPAKDCSFTGKSATLKVRPTGQILEATSIPGLDTKTMHFVLPEEAVVVGDKWIVRMLASSTGFGLPLEISYVFESIEVVDGRRCAVIRSSFTFDKAFSPVYREFLDASAELVHHFSLADGLVAKRSFRATINTYGPDKDKGVREKHVVQSDGVLE